MIYLDVQVSDEVITGLGKRYNAAKTRAMKEAIWYYHKQIFPRHFFNSNRARYRLAKRTEFYLKVIKPRRGVGSGRFVDLLLKGVSKRRMMAFATVRTSDGGNTVVLRMQAPTYFTRLIPGRPDKKSEVEQINTEDKTNIRDMIQRLINQKLQSIRSK